ncbi:hypothetical protein P170DRAFT_433213 [Aspergillus steynii IBT 23096]|uniref:Uncharacterized protein n=1 Tax=Aspergillus steynii IBT 23096 TaxID=1392250 RepID=A0A2I2GS54_9EURO|nr:uncharacterized protein P170DRAFT_433213 [Aspergillus steynii IBT 23096]PLB55706.1 hypothetical protein P170DRAFT_433213 [Aspergillus steynii IBT 23096]
MVIGRRFLRPSSIRGTAARVGQGGSHPVFWRMRTARSLIIITEGVDGDSVEAEESAPETNFTKERKYEARVEREKKG